MALTVGTRVQYVDDDDSAGTVTSILEWDDGDSSKGDLFVEWDDGVDNGHFSPAELKEL